MPGLLLHVGALVQCPHGAPIQVPPPAPPRVFVNLAQPVLSVKEVPAVAGCPFQIPFGVGTKPQPCITVRLEPAKRVFVMGAPAVLFSPVAMCIPVEQIPQGPPNAAPVQKRVIAM